MGQIDILLGAKVSLILAAFALGSIAFATTLAVAIEWKSEDKPRGFTYAGMFAVACFVSTFFGVSIVR